MQHQHPNQNLDPEKCEQLYNQAESYYKNGTQIKELLKEACHNKQQPLDPQISLYNATKNFVDAEKLCKTILESNAGTAMSIKAHILYAKAKAANGYYYYELLHFLQALDLNKSTTNQNENEKNGKEIAVGLKNAFSDLKSIAVDLKFADLNVLNGICSITKDNWLGFLLPEERIILEKIRIFFNSIIQGDKYYHEKNYSAAIQEYTQVIQLNNKEFTAYLNRARCFYYLGTMEDLNRALQDCKTLIDSSAETDIKVEAYYISSLILDEMDEAYGESIQSLFNALQLCSRCKNQADEKKERIQKELTNLLNSIKEQDPNLTKLDQLLLNELVLYSENNKLEEHDLGKAIASLFNGKLDYYIRQGDKYLDKKNYAAAIQGYTQALYSSKQKYHSRKALLKRAQCYYHLGLIQKKSPHDIDSKRAEENFNKAYLDCYRIISSSKDDDDEKIYAYYLRGCIQNDQEKYIAAIEDLRTSLKYLRQQPTPQVEEKEIQKQLEAAYSNLKENKQKKQNPSSLHVPALFKKTPPPLPYEPPISDSEIDHQLEQANALYSDGLTKFSTKIQAHLARYNYERALGMCQSIIDGKVRSNKKIEAHFLKARIQYFAEDYWGGIRSVLRALELCKNAGTQNKQIEEEIVKDFVVQLQEAKERKLDLSSVETAMLNDLFKLTTHLIKGNIMGPEAEPETFQQEILSFQNAIVSIYDKKSSSFINQGDEYYSKNLYVEAAQEYSIAIRMNAQNVETAYYGHAQCSYSLGLAALKNSQDNSRSKRHKNKDIAEKHFANALDHCARIIYDKYKREDHEENDLRIKAYFLSACIQSEKGNYTSAKWNYTQAILSLMTPLISENNQPTQSMKAQIQEKLANVLYEMRLHNQNIDKDLLEKIAELPHDELNPLNEKLKNEIVIARSAMQKKDSNHHSPGILNRTVVNVAINLGGLFQKRKNTNFDDTQEDELKETTHDHRSNSLSDSS